MKEIQREKTFTQTQYEAAIQKNHQLTATLQQNEKDYLHRIQQDRRRHTKISVIAEQQLRQSSTHIRKTVSELRHQISEQFQAFQGEISTSNNQLTKLARQTHTNPERIMELTKIEAFELWVQKQSETGEPVSAQILLQRVSAKINHTLRNLKAELHQTTAERDELQAKIEQQEENRDTVGEDNRTIFGEGETLIEKEKLADPDNIISATRKNLPPPVSIYQYYQAYKPILLTSSNLPDIKPQSCLSKEQFQKIWSRANSDARDLLIFMWVLKDLILPKALAEVTSANPNFYITRFCISALTHIAKHHEEFYTNIDNRKSLPQIEPYETDTIKEIQEIANQQFPDFLSSLDILAEEETTILHEATTQHQNLVRKFPDSFPSAFHRIQLQGYISRALDDRKHTLQHRAISTPHARTLLYLPQYDPASMRIPKRS
jgi:hypothetical protein